MRHSSPSARLSPSTDDIVDRLTRPHTTTYNGHVTDWPPLINWISDAVSEKVKRGGAASGEGDAGINEGALRILERIKRGSVMLRGWLYLAPRRAGLKPDIREAWETAHTYRLNNELDDVAWGRIIETLETWVDDIEHEWEERPSQMEITAPCPSCGERWILERADPNFKYAEDKRRTAVVVEYADGREPVVECRAEGCGAYWIGWETAASLGLTLGAEQMVEILDACGVTPGSLEPA